MTPRTPVTIVTGFLGAGKTTLLQEVLTGATRGRLGILVNEFGAVGVDGDALRSCGDCPDERIVELANGCVCCAVAEDFEPAILALLDLPDPPEHIVVETSGLAMPKPVLKAFDWPALRARATLDGVIAVVDAEATADGRMAADPDALAAQRAADETLDHDQPIAELFAQQVVCADVVVLNKCDLVAEEGRAAARAVVDRHRRAGVPIVEAVRGAAPIDALLGLGLQVEDGLADRPGHGDDHAPHDHDDFDTVVIDVSEIDDVAAFDAAFAAAIEHFGLLRMKGHVAVHDKAFKRLIQAVGPRIDAAYTAPWGVGARAGRLVAIGPAGLDAAALRAHFATS